MENLGYHYFWKHPYEFNIFYIVLCDDHLIQKNFWNNVDERNMFTGWYGPRENNIYIYNIYIYIGTTLLPRIPVTNQDYEPFLVGNPNLNLHLWLLLGGA